MMTLTGRQAAVVVNRIDLRRLKKLCQKMLPEGSILVLLVRNEPDYISAEEYCVKLGTWLTILDEEIARL